MDGKLIICFCLLLVTHAEQFQRTLIVIYKETQPSEYLFLRGGDANGHGIPIRHRVHPEDESTKFGELSEGDKLLDWNDREEGQSRQAYGTPMMWTTNDRSYNLKTNKDGAGFWDINIAKGHMWVVDVDMDCDKTHDGWFQYKGFLIQNGRPKYEVNTYKGWEQVKGDSLCEGELVPEGEHFKTGFSWADPQNHLGKCGAFNVVLWGNSTSCFIHSIQFVEKLAKGEMVEQPLDESELVEETEEE